MVNQQLMKARKKFATTKSLSELLELAINDFEAVLKDKRYKVAMWDWHIWNENDKKCEVCVAGAVIAQRFAPGKLMQQLQPEDYRPAIRDRLIALDELRSGNINGALESLNWNIIRVSEDFENACMKMFVDDDDEYGEIDNRRLLPRLKKLKKKLERVGL